MEPVDLAVEEALRGGAEQAEALTMEAHSLTLTAERWELKKASASTVKGLAVRVYSRRRLATAYTSSLDPSSVSEAAKRAVKQLKASLEDESLEGFPQPSTYPRVDGLWDEETAQLSLEDAARLVEEALKASRIDDRLASINASLTLHRRKITLANSLGVEASFKDTWARADVEASAKEADNYASGYQPKWTRSVKELSLTEASIQAAQEALEGLKAKKVKTQELPLILTGLALHMVVSSIATALDAELILHGRSFLTGRLGESVASPLITLVDDATAPGEVKSRPFDAEGTPSRRVALIEDGVLKSLLHNHYTSRKMKAEPTGHAARNGGYSYVGRVGIAPTNLILEPRGSGGVEKLASEAGRALVMKTTFDRPNLASGDLSAIVMSGYIVEGGSIAYPVKQAAVSVNLLDLLRRTVAVGGEPEAVLNVKAPPIMVEGVKVAGTAI